MIDAIVLSGLLGLALLVGYGIAVGRRKIPEWRDVSQRIDADVDFMRAIPGDVER